MPVCIGERTTIAAAMATHASAAVTPSSRTRSPTRAAVGCSQATAPFVPKTVERPPSSGLLTAVSSRWDTGFGPPVETHDRSYSLYKGTEGILASVNQQEVTDGRWQRNLRGRDPVIDRPLACTLLLWQARDSDLRGSLGPDDPEPGPDSSGR